MKFYRLNEVFPNSDDHVFRKSPTRCAIAVLIFGGLAIACLLLAREGGIHGGKGGFNVPAGLAYYISAILGLLALFALPYFLASLHSTNWLLRCNDNGVVIKYRSLLNRKLPADDLQVVSLDYAEIAWVRATTVTRLKRVLGDSGVETRCLQCLDLALNRAGDAQEMEVHLQAERKRRPAKAAVSVMWKDYPIEILTDGIIRLTWTVSPGVHKALEAVGRFVRILPEVMVEENLTCEGQVSTEEQRARILKLAKEGDELQAIALAQACGYSAKEARNFVRELWRERLK